MPRPSVGWTVEPTREPTVPRTIVVLLLAGAGLVVGVVDSVRDGHDDLALLLAAVTALVAAAIVLLLRSCTQVALRPDLAAWVRRQAAATGEPADRLADRCVAAYRAGMTGDRVDLP